jgi:hypothetical protein
MTESEIINKISSYITRNSEVWNNWHVGITEDPRNRLFSDHNVSEEDGAWIYEEGDSVDIARSVEQYFLEKGCDGGSGGGTSQSKFVYAYKKTANTNENV